MLKRFEVENFRGFKERIVLDFQSGDYKYNPKIARDGIVVHSMVYGRNGSGKSSLGLAILDVITHLTDMAQFPPQYITPYKNLDAPLDKPASFVYHFRLNGFEIVYEYEKAGPQDLLHEKLTVDDSVVVDWNYFGDAVRFVDRKLTKGLAINLVDNHLSVLKYIYRNMPTNSIPALTEMLRFVEGMLWYRSLSDGNAFAGFQNTAKILTDIIYERGALAEFTEFLAENGLRYNLEFRPINGQRVLFALFDGGKNAVPFNAVASTGTNALLLFFSWSVSAFDKLTFLFIDEFDAFFHFESAEAIVRRINEARFQSILTSHNTYLINNDLSRPDACFVIDAHGVRNLHDRTNKVIREGHNLEKMYVNGAFA